MSISSLEQETKSCDPGDIILHNGTAYPGIQLATRGDFLAYRNGVDGKRKATIFFTAPTRFGLSDKLQSDPSPYTVLALTQGEKKSIPLNNTAPKDLASIDRETVRHADKNDTRAISWQITLLRHNPFCLDERLRELFYLLTQNGSRSTPVITQKDLAALVGADRATVSKKINTFKRDSKLTGGNAYNEVPYEVTEEGKKNFLRGINLQSAREDFSFWKDYAPDPRKRLLLLEARQNGVLEERLGLIFWLLTDEGRHPTPPITQANLGRLTAASRVGINSQIGIWLDEKMLELKGRPGIYTLKGKGKDYLNSLR